VRLCFSLSSVSYHRRPRVIFSVHDVSIGLCLFPFFPLPRVFGIRWREKADLACRSVETMRNSSRAAPYPLVSGAGFSTVRTHDVELLLFVHGRKEKPVVYRPVTIRGKKSDFAEKVNCRTAPDLFLINPNVARTAFSLRGLRDYKRQAAAVGGKLQVGNTPQIQRSFRVSTNLGPLAFGRFLSNNRHGECCENEQSARRKKTIHR